MPTNIRTKQKMRINGMKEYVNIYIFSFSNGFNLKKNKNTWRDYVIPIKNKKENVSENIDKILY